MDNLIHKQGKRCSNENEKRERYLAAQRRYNSKKWYCTHCDRTLTINNKAKHLQTKIHISNDK